MIVPKILKGTRDFGHTEMAKRNFVKDTIKTVFESFGYDPIETPAIEYAETILGKYGDEGDKLTYHFEDHGDRHIALRYDQTVPFARYYAANYGSLTTPYKRYEINRVWRADKPQKGRYREFYQCDVDIIGTESILAEVELAKIIFTSLKNLGIENFNIKVNDRKLMDSILDKANIDLEKRILVIRLIDKLDKIGAEAVIDEFKKLDLSKEQINLIAPLLKNDGTNAEKLEQFKEFESTGVGEFLKYIKGTEVEEYISFDISLARGLDYYTGLIFETVIPETGLGSVAGGGRYDNLCGSFSKQKFSGVGIALGFDRIVDALEILGLFRDTKTNAKVLVVNFNEELSEFSLKTADLLREAGINTEFYFEPGNLGKQFKYADKRGIPFVVIAGPEERKENIYSLREMKTGETFNFSIDELKAKLIS